MVNFPGIRPTAEVVAILNKTPRRAQVVGMLKAEGSGDVLRLTPCDPRMPHMMVNGSSMPSEIQQRLQVPSSVFPAGAFVGSGAVRSTVFSQLLHLLDLVQSVQRNNRRVAAGVRPLAGEVQVNQLMCGLNRCC